MDCLKREPKGFELTRFIVKAVVLKFIVVVSIAIAMTMLGGVKISPVGDGSLQIKSISFPFILLMGVMIEELIFRFIPLTMVLKSHFTTRGIFFTVIFVSVFFGYLHGGLAHVFIQGFGGVILSIVFLKCGGMNKNFTKAYWSSTVCHYAFNSLVIVISVFGGVEKL